MVAATRVVSAGSLVATLTLPSVALAAGALACRHGWRRGDGGADHLAAPRQHPAHLAGHRAPAAAIAGRRRVRSVAVLGAGSWGTALAVHLARIGHPVRLWARDPALVAEMRIRRAQPGLSRPTRRSPSRWRSPTARRGAGRSRPRWSSWPCRRTACARWPGRPPAQVDAGRGRAQRHQGARGRLAAAHVGGAGRGVAARARRRGAVGPELRRRARPLAADRRRRRLAQRRRRRPRAGGVPLRRDAALRQPATSSASSSAAR